MLNFVSGCYFASQNIDQQLFVIFLKPRRPAFGNRFRLEICCGSGQYVTKCLTQWSL